MPIHFILWYIISKSSVKILSQLLQILAPKYEIMYLSEIELGYYTIKEVYILGIFFRA